MSYVELIGVLRRKARRGEALPFALTWDGAMVGQVSVNQIVGGSSRSATIGYWVAKSHAGRGVVPVAVALVCDHLFGALGLHRVEIAVRPENSASLRVVQKLGFEPIGLARSYLHINGQWRDHELFQLVRDDLDGTVLARATP
jgi:ribosomal-protein-alanine N-acetyltransferase